MPQSDYDCITVPSPDCCCTWCLSGKVAELLLCGAGVLVSDAAAAYRIAVQNGAVSAAEPVTLTDKATGQEQTVAEVKLYGDVVLRLVSGSFQAGSCLLPDCMSSNFCCAI